MLTLMIVAPERARADFAFSPDRTYYRFATVDNTEDGDLPGLKDGLKQLTDDVLSAIALRAPEQPLDTDEIKVSVFVDNMRRNIAVSDESLRRAVDVLTPVTDEFSFLRGFIK